jgi:CubicO group peptidase (beta-lactamase class C family)
MNTRYAVSKSPEPASSLITSFLLPQGHSFIGVSHLNTHTTTSDIMGKTAMRLGGVDALIQDICNISGVAGLSYGILRQGTRSYGNFGYRDVSNKVPPTEDTIYHIGSLTKFFTAVTVGALVEEGKLGWNTPIQQYLPAFRTMDDERIGEELTLVDLLSHRTGLAQKLDIWLEGGNELLLPKTETIPTCGYLEKVKPLRYEWQYNNWPYCLAGEAIENVTGKTYGTVLEERILQPLKLERTIINENCSMAKDIANAYMPLNDRTQVQVPRPQIQDGTLMGSAGGVRSCVKDLLTFYEAVMLAANDQSSEKTDPTINSPLKQLDMILSAHMPMSHSGLSEHSYGLGWARNQLPAPLGDTGLNGIFVPQMPTVLAGSKSRLVLSHHGSMPGFTTAAYLFPETATAIVVLTNSLALNDAADWVGQLLIETVFEADHPNDYVALAKSSAEAHLKIYDEIEQELRDEQIPNTSPKAPDAYVGRYWNKIENLCLEVTQSKGDLWLSFQGLFSENYKLKHYNHDTFTWHFTRDEDVRRARFTFMGASYYKFKFVSSDGVNIDELVWAHEPDIPRGEVFKKRAGKAQ